MKSLIHTGLLATILLLAAGTWTSAPAQTCSETADLVTVMSQYDSGSMTYTWSITNGNGGVGNRIQSVMFEVAGASWSNPTTTLATWTASSSIVPGYASVRFDYSSGQILNDGFTEVLTYVLDAPVTSVRVRTVRQNAKVDNFTAFSDLTACGTLPVELVGFRAQHHSDGVRLLWETASEEDNAGFEIQHRLTEEFERIGFVAGHGSSRQAQSYAFDVDADEPVVGAFRLRILSIDGSFQYSPIVRVAQDLPAQVYLSPNYPNPFNPSTSLRLMVDRDQDVQVEVFDLAGRRVALLHVGPVAAVSPLEITFDAASLPSGTYFVRAHGASITAMRIVTLLK